MSNVRALHIFEIEYAKRIEEFWKHKKTKFLGLIRDALEGVGWSFSDDFGTCSKDVENSKIQKLKLDQNTSKVHLQYV